MVQVVFITDYHIPEDVQGQRVVGLVGSGAALGAWDPNDAPRGVEYPPKSGESLPPCQRVPAQVC